MNLKVECHVCLEEATIPVPEFTIVCGDILHGTCECGAHVYIDCIVGAKEDNEWLD